MSIRFNRRFKLFPGVRLLLGKRGLGVSIGGHGVHVGVSTNGKPYASLGIPGTGIYMREDAK